MFKFPGGSGFPIFHSDKKARIEMSCFDDGERELDEAAKPYLEPLIDALESRWNTVSSNGICATVECEEPKVLMMSVLGFR